MNIPRIALVLLASLICVGCSDASEEPTPDPTGGGEQVVERYESGEKKFEGYLLEDGTKVGIWTYWYKHGQRKEEGEFKNGKKEGPWPYWFDTGSIHHYTSGIYKDDKKVADLPKKKD